jgi:hypothetical protein
MVRGNMIVDKEMDNKLIKTEICNFNFFLFFLFNYFSDMLVNGMNKEREKESKLMLMEISKFNLFIFLYIYLFFRYNGQWRND